MKDLRIIFWIFLFSLFFTGCNFDELDFDRLSGDVNYNPEVVIPIAKGNISVWDLVNAANKENENVLTKDSSGLMKIVYRQNDLLKYNVGDLFALPVDQDFSSMDKLLGDISPDNMSLSRNISLNELGGQLNGALNGIILLNGMTFPFPAIAAPGLNASFNLQEILDFQSMTLSKGTLEFVLENKLRVPLTVKGSLFDKASNKEISEFTFTNIAPGETKNSTVSLDGTDLSNQLEFRMNSFETPGSEAPVLINLEDYFKIKFNLTNLCISKGSLIIPKPLTLKGSGGAFELAFPEPDVKAFGATLKKGNLTIRSVNNLPLTGSISFTLSEIKDKNTGMPIAANVPLDGSSTVIALDDTQINFASNPAEPYNSIPYTFALTINPSQGYINYSSTDAIKLEISMNDLEFKTLTGDFGKRIISVDPGIFAINVDLLKNMKGDFKLANPSLMLTLRNSMGIPAIMNLDFMASNEQGNTVALNPPAIDVPVPANLNAGIATKTVVFNKQNSKIIDFIALPPTDDISYSGSVAFNPIEPVTPQNANFLDVDGIFAIDMAMELPLEVQISNLGFKDTTGISGSDFNKIETAELILNAVNGIPLAMDLQLLFIDTITKQQYGATKITKILSAAKPGASGGITSVQSSHTFTLDKSEIENLRKANGLVFSGSVSSPEAQTTASPIFSDSKIELNVVIKSKVNL